MEAGTGGCTGTVANPTAPEGKLCVYTAQEQANEHAIPIKGFVASGGAERYGTTGAVLQGAILEGSEENTAKIEAWGTWAVTAP
jgi:hypothetical protein